MVVVMIKNTITYLVFALFFLGCSVAKNNKFSIETKNNHAEVIANFCMKDESNGINGWRLQAKIKFPSSSFPLM